MPLAMRVTYDVSGIANTTWNSLYLYNTNFDNGGLDANTAGDAIVHSGALALQNWMGRSCYWNSASNHHVERKCYGGEVSLRP